MIKNIKLRTMIYCVSTTVLLCCVFALQPSTITEANDAAETVLTDVTTVPLHRFVQRAKDSFHFYTANQDEMAAVAKQKSYWKYEGIIGYVFPESSHPPGTVPLYRLVKVQFYQTNHYYTLNKAEYDESTSKGGWTGEGICCYVAPSQLPGTVPLIRLYKECEGQPNDGKFRLPCQDATGGDAFFYTTNGQEKFTVISQGYKFVRNEGYVWEQPTTLAGPVRIGTSSSASANPDTILLKQGCTRPAVGEYKCETQRSYETCEMYKKQGSVKACSTSVNPLIQASIDKMLFGLGCNRFLGRADEFMCKTQNGLDLCETYRKNGKLKKCVMAK